MDWLRIEKGICQGCILSFCLFIYKVNHAKCWVVESQARIKIAKRNNLRYADDTTLMAESEEELKCLDEGERRVKKLA